MKEDFRTDFDEFEEDTQKGKFLTFSLGEEYYGIDIMYVTEIVGIQPITVVPEMPDFIKGIINLRGKIIPVMDVRIKFRKEEKEYNDRTCIIVIDVQELSIGIIVDAVSEVLNIDDENIVPPPNMNASGRKYIKSVGKSDKNVILIL
ncbi:MAG: purine-binding chemotaxis protein CheW, partial [Vallitaleaceae bacterium]|nr:purine-binding chemotaxis protein CheW [Vallitaleaceae bacterium]